MITIAMKEFKARTSAILRDLAAGDSVIITRHGKPCAKLTSLNQNPSDRQSLSSLKGIWSDLPDVSYEEFRALKGIWDPKSLEPGAQTEDLRAR